MQDYFNDIVKNLSQIIRFDSSEAPAKAGMPFGDGNAKCLAYFLSLADYLGFKTKNLDNYAGEVTFGRGKPFAVLCHLDVVPAGSGWTHEPFGGEVDEVNKRIWGRGAMDDKGPAVITLFALKALKDEGFKPKRKIKLILGCNEETGWACIEHYKKVAKMPKTGFSPDADFPVIYAEKGILHVSLSLNVPKHIRHLKGGSAANMVCAYCEAETDANEADIKALGLEYDGVKVISRGKSAHGSTPEKGVNAIEKMLTLLNMEDLRKAVFEDKLGLKDIKDETGELTLSPNVIEKLGNKIFVTCDIRYPATYNVKQVTDILDGCGYEYSIIHHQEPLFNDRESNLIKTLLSVYNEVTGKNAQPVAIGGGTYARALKVGAAFGPEEDDEECTIHQPDEYITFEKIEKCFKIYKLAIKRLCG